MRAIQIEGMNQPPFRDPGPEPAQEWLPIDKLVIDLDYQREVHIEGRRAIEAIARKFEWTKFSAVVVAPVSLGRYAIIDGQHRTTAAKLCGLTRVPCIIQALDRAGQAAAFAAINGSVTKITPWHIYKAALAAGEGWATQARRVTEAAGCRLMTYNKSMKERDAGELYGVNTLRDLINKHGEATVTLALKAYRSSVYGDLPIAWATTLVCAWIAAIAATPGASSASVEKLAAFHDGFDILEHDDNVQTAARAARREGQSPPAHWAALAAVISEAMRAHIGGQDGHR